jgi:hypothetical protein
MPILIIGIFFTFDRILSSISISLVNNGFPETEIAVLLSKHAIEHGQSCIGISPMNVSIYITLVLPVYQREVK